MGIRNWELGLEVGKVCCCYTQLLLRFRKLVAAVAGKATDEPEVVAVEGCLQGTQ